MCACISMHHSLLNNLEILIKEAKDGDFHKTSFLHRFLGSCFCWSTSRPVDFQTFKSWNCYSFWMFTIYLTSRFSWPYWKQKVEKKLFKMDYFAEEWFWVQTYYLKKIKRMILSRFLTAKGKLSQKSKAFWTNLVCDAIWQKSGLGNIVPDCLAMIYFSSKAQASTKILSEMEVAPRSKLLA